MFLVMGLLEGFSGGANLPGRPVPRDVAALVALVCYHLVLLCTLLAAGWIEYDGLRLPMRLMLPALAVGALVPLAWPEVRPVAAWAGWSGWPGWIEGLTGGVAGIAAGSLVGLVVWGTAGPRGRLGLVAGPACVGLFLGWQAGVVLGAVAAVFHLAAVALGRWWPGLRRPFPALWLAATAFAWILAWKDLVRLPVSWGIL
jgi:hypothetical protein